MTNQLNHVDEKQMEKWRMECIPMLKNQIIEYIGTKRQELEYIVNHCIDNVKSLRLLQNDDTLKHIKAFKFTDEDIQKLCKYFLNKIEAWRGIRTSRLRRGTYMNKLKYHHGATNWLTHNKRQMGSFYVKFVKTDLTSYCHQISLQSISSSKKLTYGFIREINNSLCSDLIIPISLYQLIFCYYYCNAKYYYNFLYFQALFDVFTATKAIPQYIFTRCEEMNDYLTTLGTEHDIEWDLSKETGVPRRRISHGQIQQYVEEWVTKLQTQKYAEFKENVHRFNSVNIVYGELIRNTCTRACNVEEKEEHVENENTSALTYFLYHPIQFDEPDNNITLPHYMSIPTEPQNTQTWFSIDHSHLARDSYFVNSYLYNNN